MIGTLRSYPLPMGATYPAPVLTLYLIGSLHRDRFGSISPFQKVQACTTHHLTEARPSHSTADLVTAAERDAKVSLLPSA